MTYELRTTAGGGAEIIQTRSFGVFDDPAAADHVLRLLLKDEGALTTPSYHGAHKPLEQARRDAVEKPVSIANNAVKVPEPPAATEPTPAPASAPAKAEAARAETKTVDPDDLTLAFSRIKAGEKLGDVAEDYGMTMPQLRARWAAHQKKRLDEGHEVALVDGQERCACGRPFVPSLERPDSCARCANA
jgi:LysM repeat protein